MQFFYYLSGLFRSAFRNKGLTLINMTGLGVGLAASMFLLVYLHFEFSYDRHFPDSDRIYRILTVWDREGKVNITPTNLGRLAPALMAEVPEVETASRLFDWGNLSFQYEKGEEIDLSVYMVDSTFLRIFDFPAVYGNPIQALNEPGKCVITREFAERFFGTGINPVGKVLVNEKMKGKGIFSSIAMLEIAAVIENVPVPTHLQFGLLTKLVDFGFEGFDYYTYFKLRAETDSEKSLEKCAALNVHLLEASRPESKFSSITEPLRAIHIFTHSSWDLTPTANRINLFFIILVTLFVLGVAVCNFISLYLIQGERRALEISIRKTNGAARKNIVGMLLGESFLVTMLAFGLAILLYRSFAGPLAGWLNFDLSRQEPDGMLWGGFILLFIIVAFIVGGYPAYFLSRFQPSDLLRKSVVRKYRLTVASVVVQFTVVFFCVASLWTVRKQLNFVETLPLGYDPENVLVVNLPVYKLTDAAFQELLQYPVIETVAQGDGVLVGKYSKQAIYKLGQTEDQAILVEQQRVGRGYLDLYRIPILQGRNFYDDLKADSAGIILSESAAKTLELGDEPLGQKIILQNRSFTVIGIAGDIYYTSLHNKRGNLIYTVSSDLSPSLLVRFEPDKYAEAKEAVNRFLEKQFAEKKMQVVLMKDLLKRQYRQDGVTGRILTSGTFLAIGLALTGLLALMGFVVRQKKQEISIRRVWGAQIGEIIRELNYYVICRILPAVPVGLFLSYYVMERWLAHFAYRIPLGIEVFLGTLGVTIGLVIFTLFFQSLRAATANPVDALKSE